MQVIYKDEVERVNSGGTDPVDSLLCIGRISRYLEREHHGKVRYRRGRI